MTFDEWMLRPVYVAQCLTWAKAAELDLCCVRFRCLPAYRDDLTRNARNRVAAAIRADRQHQRRH